jgi:hypothetical protein
MTQVIIPSLYLNKNDKRSKLRTGYYIYNLAEIEAVL